MEEKRAYKRTNLDSTVTLNLLNDGGNKTVEGVRITNVSHDGIGFHCREQLMVGNIFETTITLWTKQDLNCILKIVRAEQKSDDTYEYGAAFIGMEDREALRILVYQMFNDKE